MPVTRLSRILLCLGLVLAAASPVRGEYVRDQIRINMRVQPGTEYRILRVLQSGDQVAKLSEKPNWVRIRTQDGEEGWVPTGYLTPQVPASVTLPGAKAKLARALDQVGILDSKLQAQTEAITELETLRERNALLETENLQLSGAATWRNLGAGAAIILVGMIIGALIPRGNAARRSRIKL